MNFNFNNVNTISEFNKIFNQNLGMINSKFDVVPSDNAFEEVFNSKYQGAHNKPGQKISGKVSANVGVDAINAQKIENLSDTARMANDISKGFSNGINNLNQAQRDAEDAFETLASGGDISVHDVMIAAQKSNLSMQMAIQLRNQMINAYNEFKNIRI